MSQEHVQTAGFVAVPPASDGIDPVLRFIAGSRERDQFPDELWDILRDNPDKALSSPEVISEVKPPAPEEIVASECGRYVPTEEDVAAAHALARG